MADETPVIIEQDPSKVELLTEIEKDLPAGIFDFLDTAIVEPPEVPDVVDIDTAILAQGIASKYILDMIRPYKGLTPISIPMFMAQLNTVQHGILLSGLETAEPTEEERGLLTILDPEDGNTYKPGELRITAVASKDIVLDITAQLGEHEPIQLRDVDGDTWRNYVEVPDVGDYTLTFTATMFDEGDYAEDMGPLEQVISFTVSEEAEDPAEGADKETIDTARTKLQDALKALADQSITDVPGYAENLLNVVKAQYSVYAGVAGKVLKGDVAGAVDVLLTEANGVIENFEQEIENYDPEGEPLSLGNIVGKLWNIAGKVDGVVESILN